MLTQQYSARHLLDARRPSLGQDLQPITQAQKQENRRAAGFAVAFAGAGLLLGFD